jgi:3-oxoacyl-[acyl-carrier-protein] synthase-3
MKAYIRAIEYYLPEKVLTNEELANSFPDWTADRIFEKTGIKERRVVRDGELASDLAEKAAHRLFEVTGIERSSIDYVIFCTQSPDYALPTTACLLQERLGIPTNSGALDINLGCSAYPYGLGLAKGLIETGQAKSVLLLTGETMTLHLSPEDVSVRAIFGDGAAATLVCGRQDTDDSATEWIGPFYNGSDGRGASKLILRRGSLREPNCQDSRWCGALDMNGPDIFAFTLQEVPKSVLALLEKAGIRMQDVDLFVFHQANRFMLEHLRRKLQIPSERFVYALENSGNTVCATIPIALKHAWEGGQLRDGSVVVLVGFGVGYSWSACVIRWSAT